MRYLLLIASDGNVVLADADNRVRMPIGQPLIAGQQSRVSSAVWSPGGEWTAWAVDSESPDGACELRIHDEDTDQSWVLAESVRAFYLCSSPDGRWLSHLSPGPLGLELALSEVSTGEVKVIERGQPLFWSWSSDGAKLAVHVEDRVLIADVPVDVPGDKGGSAPEVICQQADPFIVPWWLPGGSLAYAAGGQIVSTGPDGVMTTLVDSGTTGRFSPDPDGRRIAHIEVDGERTRLVVADLLGGEQQVVTTDPVGCFFWSRDGGLLAALVGADGGGVQWLVFDGSKSWTLPSFRPSRSWAATVLPFFEQYAQSHSHWSPDGRQLIAPAVDADGLSGALIQDIDPSVPTQWMPDAELAWWA
ncbi:MAG: hypothetical protein ACRBK7_17780 [Acidimicrobiales bacterium]